ncbi:MAG: ferritin-like domain-containing protein [Myxococcota bacterium]
MNGTLKRESGVFADLHRQTIGAPVDLSDLRPGDHPPALVEEARRTWADRVRTEHRSIQIMARFLTEVTGAGDPLDVYAGALDMARDEVRHTELCAAVCRALGTSPPLPDPVALRDPPRFLAAPLPERALHTALTMLVINETLSVAFIRDLAGRCDEPAIRRVLEETAGDETGHEAFGWTYVERSLTRFPDSTRSAWRELVRRTFEPHERMATPILERLPADRRQLGAWPDRERANLGLFSPERQALVYQAARDGLRRRLAALDLWPA